MSAPLTSGLITIVDQAEATAVDLAYNPFFYQRVAQIAVEVAYAVVREQDGGTTIAGHANRATTALQYLLNSSVVSRQVQMAQVALRDNTDIDLSSTSQAIADKLTAGWDTISGN